MIVSIKNLYFTFVRGKPITYYLLENLKYADQICIPYNEQILKDFPDYNFIYKIQCTFDTPILFLDGNVFYTEDVYSIWNGRNISFPGGQGYHSYKRLENPTQIDIKYISLATPQDILKFYDLEILYDLDGTIVHTDEAYRKTWFRITRL